MRHLFNPGVVCHAAQRKAAVLEGRVRAAADFEEMLGEWRMRSRVVCGKLWTALQHLRGVAVACPRDVYRLGHSTTHGHVSGPGRLNGRFFTEDERGPSSGRHLAESRGGYGWRAVRLVARVAEED